MRNTDGIIVVITCLVLALPLFGCGGGREAVVVGIEPIKDVAKAENNAQSLRAWVVNKARADVLVHIDTSDDMAIFRGELRESVENAADHLKRRNVDVIDRIAPFLENGGFINLGYLAGLYKRVIWVVPLKTSIGEAQFEGLKNFLMFRRGFQQSDLDDLAFTGTSVEGTLAGVPLTVTSLNDLTLGDETAILDIDLSYFMGLKAQDPAQQVGTRSLLEFLRTVKDKHLRSSFVSVVLSTQSQIVPMDMRFFGDIIREALSDPANLGDRPPEKWSTMIAAEDSLVSGRYGGAEDLYELLVRNHPHDPGLRFTLAITQGYMEKGKQCRQEILAAYRLDEEYIRGFFQLANVLAVKGKVSAGLEILETPELATLVTSVDIDYGKGGFYLNAGRPGDALRYLEKAARVRPNDFFLHSLIYRANRAVGDEKGMIASLEKLLKIDEERFDVEMPWAYKELGDVYEGEKLYGNAAEMYERYLKIVQDDSNAAVLHEKIKKFRETRR